MQKVSKTPLCIYTVAWPPLKNNLIFVVSWEIMDAKHIVRTGVFYHSISSGATFFAWQYHHRSFNSEKGRPKRYENAINYSVLKPTMFLACTKKLHHAVKLAVLVSASGQTRCFWPAGAGGCVCDRSSCCDRSGQPSRRDIEMLPETVVGQIMAQLSRDTAERLRKSCVFRGALASRWEIPNLSPASLSWLLGSSSSSFHSSDWSKQHISTIP